MKKHIKIKSEMVKNQKKIGHILSRFKYGLDNQVSIRYLIENVHSRDLLGYKYIFEGLVINEIPKLSLTQYIPYYENSSLISEIRWAYEVLKRYNSEINRFNILKDEYEKSLLMGDYSSASDINKKIWDEITVSLWGIENEFLLKQLSFGFEENRKFLSKTNEENNNQIINILCDFYSYKSDTETTYGSLEHRLDKFLEYYTDESFYFSIAKNYLKYKLLLIRETFNSSELAIVLSYESTMSVIDYYNTFIDVIALAISKSYFNYSEIIEISNLLSSMKEKFTDLRINNLLLLVLDNITSIELNNKYDFEFSKIVDLYTVGRYETCINVIQEKLNDLCNINDVMEIHSKSTMFSDASYSQMENCKSNIYKKMHQTMVNIYCCENKLDRIFELIDCVKLISHLTIRYGLLNFIQKQLIFVSNNDSNQYMDFIYSKVLTPRTVFLFKNKKQIQYLEVIKQKKQFEETTAFVSSYLNKDINSCKLSCVSHYRMQYYYAKLHKNISTDIAIDLFKGLRYSVSRLRNNEERYYFERSSKELYYLYIDANQEFEAMNIIVDAYLKDSSFSVRMDQIMLYKKINSLGETLLLNFYKSIKWPIFNYIYNQKNYQNLYVGLISFLENNNIVDPMILVENHENILTESKVELIFILDKLYIFDIMKRYVYFDVKQKYLFRIKVLDYLKRIDTANTYKYEKEIKELFYEQGIKEKMKTIDQNRIYVDVKKIISENQDIFKNKYKRFISLKKIPISLNCTDIYGLNRFWLEITKSIKRDPEIQQKYALLKEICIEFSREFLYNPNYGLEKFLSTRIRHGMLDNYLLKPFNNHRLLSTMDNANNFKLNKYWNEKINRQFNNDNNISYENLINSMNKFTRKIINKINEIKNWIRVNSKEHKEGMFDYQRLLDGEGIIFIYSDLEQLEGYIDYEVFYQKIIDIFWNCTDELLFIIRSRFENEVKAFFMDSIEELEKEIKPFRSLIHKDIYREIQNNIVSCKSKLRSDIDNVVNWFYIRKDNDCNDYKLDELFKIVIETNNKLNNEYDNVTIKVTNDETKLRGDTFIYLWDLINILYSNALTHSGFSDYKEVEIELSSNVITNEESEKLFNNINIRDARSNEVIEKMRSSEVLCISISNNLSESIDEQKLTQKIQTKFELMNSNEDYKSMVAKEGGTGLVKIYSIIKNIDAPHIIIYSICDKRITFSIYLEITAIKCKEEICIYETSAS